MKIKRKVKRLLRRFCAHFKIIKPVYIPVLNGNLLEGRTAFITGGTSGIGFAIAEAFLQNGASVVITSRSQERIDSAIQKIKSAFTNCGEVYGIVMDNQNTSSFENCVNDAIEKCGGRIDILVNNAGIAKGGFISTTEDSFDTVIETNLKAAFFLSRIFANYWKLNKIKGNILNVASSSSLRPAISPYTLSKWGIRGLTLGLAKTLIPYGIVVNGIAPGPTATPMLTDDAEDLSLLSNPTGRYATAEEIANLATIIVSSMGQMVVGDVLYATGGAGLITFDDMKYDF